jgi:uncharacterized protein DUF6510
MTEAVHVDANALGGMFLEVFGREMTDARGCCAACESVHPVGAMPAYRGAGDVVRCPSCANVMVVAVTIRDRTRVHLTGVRWLEVTPG